METYYAFLLTLIASLSTFFGGLIILLRIKPEKLIKFSLLFSSIIMSFISLMDLIPASFIEYKFIPRLLYILISVNIGVIVSIVFDQLNKGEGSLKKLGWLTLFVIVLHNILEGVITFVTISYNLELGIKLFFGIFLHNIPEGLILATLIFNNNKKRGLALFITLLSGFQEFFGSLLAYLFLLPYMNDFIISGLYSIVAGIMLYLSLKSFLEYIKLKY